MQAIFSSTALICMLQTTVTTCYKLQQPHATNYSNHMLQVCNFHRHHHECPKFHSLQFVSNLTRCGTRSVSTVQTVTDLWIQYWHVMVLTARYTARHAIQRSLVPRALVMAMLLLWCLPMENQLFLSK